MFGGPPPPPSKAELKAAEDMVTSEIQWTIGACVVLYLSPFMVDWARKLV